MRRVAYTPDYTLTCRTNHAAAVLIYYVCKHMCICMSLQYVYIHMYVCTYIYIYIYTYIHIITYLIRRG